MTTSLTTISAKNSPTTSPSFNLLQIMISFMINWIHIKSILLSCQIFFPSVNSKMSCLIFTKAREWERIEQNLFDRGKSLTLKEINTRACNKDYELVCAHQPLFRISLSYRRIGCSCDLLKVSQVDMVLFTAMLL